MRYKRSHKSLNSYSLVEYNKIYHNTNSWEPLQEESLWQVDFDNLYFWNTFDEAEMFTSEVHDPYARTASAWK